ncbi:retrovirus-related Pol polyprotein from transposon 17.6 [Trichonephila clavipes]|uniref:Retrovirus-related Pol polyprotein from transposon 17.6 n=1 Tax=Trichonephila clavipes TaxID=2585209 RepID=A0A8X6T6L9_TRICX|nr:retrovirus-related Pol polyprotein from transposon 17.6 [Trichonephila clavipes]
MSVSCVASKTYRYVLVITDHFSKWAEIIPLKKASARIIADSLFDNYISRYGAPVKLMNDNGSQFISDIFEHLSNRLGIRHVKTVVNRPQANRTERVNRDLVQMIDQVRLYHHRKRREEIRTSSFDSNSSRSKSSNFEGVQPRSNESQYSRKNGSGERREIEEKGTGLKKDQGKRHTSIASNRGPLVRSSPGSWTEPNRRAKSIERKPSHIKGRYKLDQEDKRGNIEMVQWSPDHSVRRGDNKEDQLDPEEAENNSTAPTRRSTEGQAIGVPEAEEGSNSIARRGQEEQTQSKIPIL